MNNLTDCNECEYYYLCEEKNPICEQEEFLCDIEEKYQEKQTKESSGIQQ